MSFERIMKKYLEYDEGKMPLYEIANTEYYSQPLTAVFTRRFEGG